MVGGIGSSVPASSHSGVSSFLSNRIGSHCLVGRKDSCGAVALRRCVGTRTTDPDQVVHDRHGDSPDPFVKLRRDIVRCFTSTDTFESIGKEPLTHNHRFQRGQEACSESPAPKSLKDTHILPLFVRTRLHGLRATTGSFTRHWPDYHWTV
jgi:hypothetical protein